MLNDMLDKQLKKVQIQMNPVLAEFGTPQIGPLAPTEKQIKFYKMLVTDKHLTDEQRYTLKTALATYDKRTISKTIDWLLGLPWKPKPVVAAEVPKVQEAPKKIPQGYYAVTDPLDGVLKFYRVRVPKNGKWQGMSFLSQVSGDNHLSMRDKAERDRIYGEIEKDITGALKRFGQEIGQCGHCRKQLTDEDSRKFGIGPVCRKGLGI